MRYFDITKKNEILFPDFTIGYTTPDKLFIAHHEAKEEVGEQGHYITLKEYPNGGKDVQWVVDVPGVLAQEAWDEYEDIMVWHEYSEEELANMKQPSQLDRIEAQVLYTALMTNTALNMEEQNNE